MTEKKTNICCLNAPKSVVEYLQKEHAVFDGCMGKRMDLSAKSSRQFILPKTNFPPNFQEYNVYVIDLKKPKPITYYKEDHKRKYIEEGKDLCFLSGAEQTMYDTIPFGAWLLRSRINATSKQPLIILFQEERYEREMNFVERTRDEGYRNSDVNKFTNYDFAKWLPFGETHYGEQIELAGNSLAQKLFGGMVDNLYYEQTFVYPQKFNSERGEYENEKDFLPLLYNGSREIVSFVLCREEEPIYFVLPQADDATKAEIVKRLFEGLLYEQFSSYFPLVEKAKWIHKQEYAFPEVQEVDNRIAALEKEFEENKQRLEQQKKECEEKYNYLHKLITATGAELVQAMITYLQWLGFADVKDKDKSAEDTLEEDIYVDLGDEGLLIIEVKGLYGTSKDSECSQIDKIRYRRSKQKENKGRDIYALYVVNHQRGVEPKERQNPPFTDNQIEDAISVDRGLLTTWELFKAYLTVELGVMSKEQIRMGLLKSGVITFEPDLVKPLNEPYHTWQKGMVLGINVDTPISVGDTIYVKNEEGWHEAMVCSIRQEDRELETVIEGKTGIGLSRKLPCGKLYVKHQNE